MTHHTNTTVAELAEPFIEAIERLTAVADRLESIDLADMTDETRRAVFAADRAVRDAAQAVTLRARFGLRAEQRHLADAITPLFIALAGTMTVMDEVMMVDAEATWLRPATD